MFIVVNVVFVAAAVLLILVIAATSSIPSRHAAGTDSPEGEWMGPARLPNDRVPSFAPGRTVPMPHKVAATVAR